LVFRRFYPILIYKEQQVKHYLEEFYLKSNQIIFDL